MIIGSIIKEVRLLLRDPGVLATMFAMPVAFMAFFGFVFKGVGGPGDETPPSLALFAAAENQRATRVADALTGSGDWKVRRETSAGAVHALVAEGDVQAGLILDAEFDPSGGHPAVISIDEAQGPAAVLPVQGSLDGAIARALVPSFAVVPDVYAVRTSPPGLKKPLKPVDSFQVTVPGNAVLFVFFLALGLAVSFGEERRSGIWRRTLASPVPRAAILLAKLVPFFLIGMIQLAFFFALGVFAFGMSVAGSPLALVVVSAACVLCSVALGLLLASFGGSEKLTAGLGTTVILILGLVSGCMFPRVFMPEAVRKMGLLTPHGWALDAYNDILIRGGTTVADVMPMIGALLGFAVLFAGVGCAIFRFER